MLVCFLNEEASDEEEDEDESGSEDSGSQEDSQEEEDSEEEDQDDDLHQLVKQLDPRMQQKLKSKQPLADEDDEDDEAAMKAELSKKDRWGKKKQYYDGDTADLEIGQDFGEAEEEAEGNILEGSD